MPVLLAAFLLGFVAGLRVFTAPAVLWLMRRTSLVAYLLGLAAIVEYALDLNPTTPARTRALSLGLRIVSGACCGWVLASMSGAPAALAAALGALGAIAGAYAGLAARLRAIAVAGRVPAALLEDAVAILAAVFVVANA